MSNQVKTPYHPPKVVLFSFVPREDLSANEDFFSEENEVMGYTPYSVGLGGGRAIISGEIDVPGTDWD